MGLLLPRLLTAAITRDAVVDLAFEEAQKIADAAKQGPRSSSASRFSAGASGFFILSQSVVGRAIARAYRGASPR